MNILENLLSTFKEILYDIIGYLLPGLFILFLIYVPFKLGHFYSFMYAIYEIIFKPKINFPIDFLINPPKFSFITIFTIIFSSYLLGHLPVYISTLFKNIFDLISNKQPTLKNILSPKNRYKQFNKNIINILEDTPDFKKDLFMSSYRIKDTEIEIMNYNENFLITFASTNSRFTAHNDLIQKYICKMNFYNSFSCIFFILFIDSIISGFIWSLNNPLKISLSLVVKLILLRVLLLLFFLSFFKQYKNHYTLKLKECYLFLYEYFNNKESKKADCS